MAVPVAVVVHHRVAGLETVTGPQGDGVAAQADIGRTRRKFLLRHRIARDGGQLRSPLLRAIRVRRQGRQTQLTKGRRTVLRLDLELFDRRTRRSCPSRWSASWAHRK
jgi:hypothetical protein